MVTAWPPVAFASDACTLKIGLRFVGRLPEPPSRKPLHLSVGMFLTNPVERRQQVCALSGAKCRRQPAGEDRPVRVARWHFFLVVCDRSLGAEAS
jgi:hypothetical protein